jgi:hypothetical protein
MSKHSQYQRLSTGRRLGVEILERRELLAVGLGAGAATGLQAMSGYVAGASAGQQKGLADQTKQQDQLRDGSCQLTTTISATADQIQQRDRIQLQTPARDGSCRV